MATKKTGKPTEPEDDDALDGPLNAMSDTDLAAYVAANPYAHLSQFNTRRLFKIGEKKMREIIKMNPPEIRRRFNPAHFHRWLWENQKEVAGINN